MAWMYLQKNFENSIFIDLCLEYFDCFIALFLKTVIKPGKGG